MKEIDQSRQPLLLIRPKTEKMDSAVLFTYPSHGRQVDQDRHIGVARHESQLQIAAKRYGSRCPHAAALQREIQKKPITRTQRRRESCLVPDSQSSVLTLFRHSPLARWIA